MSSSKKFYIDRGIGRWELTAIILSFIIAMFAISYTLIAYTPIRTLIPGYPDEQMRQQQVETALRIDTLERNIARWELYVGNLHKVIAGEKPLSIESLVQQADSIVEQRKIADLARQDSLVRGMASEMEKSRKNTVGGSAVAHIEGMHLDKPTNGAISKRFDYSFSPYIDISAPEGTMVRSVLDGTIIYEGWSELDGWCIVIQHDAGIISVYMHCNKPLYKVSDRVSAGGAIALIGKSGGDAEKGSHLHFELWQNGSPLDPTKLINF